MARDAAFWGRAASITAAAPQWYAAAEAIPYLAPASEDVDPRYRMLVDAAIAGDEAFERKRETIDEYGWRNFGDTYADHENPFSGEAEPILALQQPVRRGHGSGAVHADRVPAVAAHDELAVP